MQRCQLPVLPFLLAGLLALGVVPFRAAGDVVHLKNGQRLQGEAVALGGEIAIRSAIGELRLPADLVERIEPGTSPEQAAIRRLEAMRPEEVDGRVRLAMELDSRGESTLARRIYDEVLALDPDNPVARRSLGYVRCDDEWTTEEQCHRRRGDVLYGGRWVSLEERTTLEALENERRRSELERLRAQVQMEAALLQAERQAAATYEGAPADTFGYPFDPYYHPAAGAPFWPTVPFFGFDPFDPFDPMHGKFDRFGGKHGFGDGRRHGFDHGRHGFRGPVHHRGGQPPRPLVPQHHRGTRTPASGRPVAPSSPAPNN